ncbi:MAG TPA: MMPL family transporter [Mycobacteriales bacterium]|nr:MMPL family transporter [Mycobacteriales bacterium]
MTRTRSGSGPVLNVARWSTRHRWTAVTGWVLFVTLTVLAGGAAGNRQLSGVDTGAGQSKIADKATEGAYFGDKPTEAVLIQARHGSLDPAEVTAVTADLTRHYAGLRGIGPVGKPVPSRDGHSRLVTVTLDTGTLTGSASSDRAEELVGPMLAATGRVQADHPDLRVEQVGGASIDRAIGNQSGDDLRRAELTSIPVTLAILLVVFGALFAAGVPVLLALTAVAGAMGLSALASHLVPLADAASSVVLLIGMAVGVDYSLFYIRREREERARGASGRDSIEIAAATSGRAVVISGITVLIAMAGLLLSGNAVFTSLAVGTMLVVAVAVTGSVTVLPALLALLGERIERPRVPLVHRLRGRGGRPGGVRYSRTWAAVLRVVSRRPVVSFGLAALAMAALAAPALQLRTALPGTADLPRSIPIMRSYDRLNAAFPDQGAEHEVVVTATGPAPLSRAGVTTAAGALSRQASASGLFALDPAGVPRFSTDGRVAVLDLPIPYRANDSRAGRSLDLLRDRLVPATFGRLPHTWSGVTGQTAGERDFGRQIAGRLPLVFGFVLGLTFLVMLLTFRSVVVAATSIVLNLLSVGAAYGLLVLVFQHRWAQGLLGFRSDGGIVTWLPLFLFVVLFGLSMDYHIFVVSRIREAVRVGLPTVDAVRHGVLRSASTVTSAAVIMTAVFSVFATLSMLEFKQVGVGLAAAILIDATVVRGVLLPAAMSALGRYNWYLPSWLDWLPGRGRAAGHAAGDPVPVTASPVRV